LAELRSLQLVALDEAQLFPSEYETRDYFRVETEDLSESYGWRLERARSRAVIKRRLFGDRVADLAEFYGPLEALECILAEEEGQTVGLLTWKLERWSGLVWLCDIRVRPERRGSGIGTALVAELEWSAARAGARGIMLETQNLNYPAIRFYESRGFRLVGLNTHLYGLATRPLEVALYLYRPLDRGPVSRR